MSLGSALLVSVISMLLGVLLGSIGTVLIAMKQQADRANMEMPEGYYVSPALVYDPTSRRMIYRHVVVEGDPGEDYDPEEVLEEDLMGDA